MKKAVFLSVLSGLLLSLAWPERGFPLLIFIAWAPLFYVSDGVYEKKIRRVFPYYFLTFLIFNLAVTYWIYFATPAGAFFAVIANSFLMSLTLWLWHRSRKKLPPAMYWPFLVSLWIAFEFMHFRWDLEWPWLTMGNVFAAWPNAVQWYAYTGVLGGSLWVLSVNILLYQWLKRRKKKILYRLILSLLIPFAISMFIYYGYEEKGLVSNVLIVQPNVDPWSKKFERENTEAVKDLENFLPSEPDTIDLILLPETYLARGMEIADLEHDNSIRMLQLLADRMQTDILTGVAFYHTGRGKMPETANFMRNGKGWYLLYNSALFIRPDNRPAVYHKSILVPGAEKMPYRKILEPLLGDLVLDLGGMTGTHTPSDSVILFNDYRRRLKIAPMICYESVFGNHVAGFVRKGANLIAVITNDGWWKKTGGYRQHFDYARLRAVEMRRDVVRSANTGRSGHINQRGDVVKALGYGKRGMLLAEVHLNDTLTFYARYGDYLGRLAVFLALLFFVYSMGRKKIKFGF